MPLSSRTAERSVAITLFGVVAFNRPLIDVFDAGPDTAFTGTPPIVLYIFGVWTLFVALLALTMRRRRKPDHHR